MTSPDVRVSTAPPDFFDPTANGNLPPMPYKNMPEPLPLGKVLGPSVILAGLGVGSGEYIIWPYMASTVGLGFLWAAVLSVTVQYFLNMEIERYTLATGETAVAGFVRFWKPWGGVNNLAQSNWIRDKGVGMGAYIPRIVSPITGEEVAAPATGSMLRRDAENLHRFQGWWTVANKEQLVSFWFICIFSISVFSVLAYSTLHGQPITGEANLGFILAEGRALKAVVAPWFGTFFWVFGSLSLVLVSLGVIDYISRIVADVVKTVYLPQSQRWTESRVYFTVVWSTVAAGSIILLSGVNQPLLLLVIAACLNGMVMFVYSILLIQLNRRGLPPALRVRGLRLAMLVFATVLWILLGLACDRAGAELPGFVSGRLADGDGVASG